MTKLIFLGDSLTWGGYGGSFFDALDLPDYELVNMGVGGHTVVNLVKMLDKVTDQNPDGVFVMVGGNDAISHVQPRTRPYYEQVKGIPDGDVTPEMFQSHYRTLLNQLQAAYIQTWVGLPPAEYSQTVVNALLDYNRLAREVAEALRLDVLDLMAHFVPEHIPDRPPLDMNSINLIGKRTRSGWDDYAAEREQGGFTFTFDGLHFTPEAAKKAARLISDFITA